VVPTATCPGAGAYDRLGHVLEVREDHGPKWCTDEDKRWTRRAGSEGVEVYGQWRRAPEHRLGGQETGSSSHMARADTANVATLVRQRGRQGQQAATWLPNWKDSSGRWDDLAASYGAGRLPIRASRRPQPGFSKSKGSTEQARAPDLDGGVGTLCRSAGNPASAKATSVLTSTSDHWGHPWPVEILR